MCGRQSKRRTGGWRAVQWGEEANSAGDACKKDNLSICSFVPDLHGLCRQLPVARRPLPTSLDRRKSDGMGRASGSCLWALFTALRSATISPLCLSSNSLCASAAYSIARSVNAILPRPPHSHFSHFPTATSRPPPPFSVGCLHHSVSNG